MDSNVTEFLKTKGCNVISEDIESKLGLWTSWYRGRVSGFHNYKVYSGRKKLNQRRRTLNMAARVCRDWADLLLNERVKVNVSDKHTQDVLNRLLRQVNFYVRGNNLIEASFAKGGGFFIQYWDGLKVRQKYITQDMMYPITYDSGRLTEAAFASQKTIKGKKYVYLEVHLKDDNGLYRIENFLLKSDGGSLTEVSREFYDDLNFNPTTETHSEYPSFQNIRPNVANKDDFDSPYGTSVFADSTDCFEGADIVYDGYIKEVILGRKRIFARDGATNFHIDSKGNTTRVFDPNDEVFYLLPDTDDNTAPPIIDVSSDLRIAEFDQALQTQLNLISQACGFGPNGYKWENGVVTTATQVISEDSKMFRTLQKHEIILNEAITGMCLSLLNFEKLFNRDKEINLSSGITVDFDDSIIEDTAEIKRQALLEYNAGLIDAVEYYKRVYKFTDEQAKKFYADISARKPKIENEPEGF